VSRWAERFAALSGRPDTSDTSDTRLGSVAARPCVANCQSAPDRRSAVPGAPKSAEILGSADGGRPSVNSVTSVNAEPLGTERLAEGEPEPSPTLLTEADTRSLDDVEERAAIIEEAADAPRRWAQGYAALCTMAPPSGFSPERWHRVVDAAGMFLDRWGAEAIRCGWRDLDVFGCDEGAPAARFDCMGLALLLDRCKVVAIDQDGADLVTASGARQRFYRRPLPPGTVSLWMLRP
jgi:hypothetical protein